MKATPTLRVLCLGVTGEQNTASGLAAMIGIPEAANGEIGLHASAEDTVIFLPETAAALEKHFAGGIVVELADRSLFGE